MARLLARLQYVWRRRIWYTATETVIAAIVLKPHFIIFTPALHVYNDGGPSQIADDATTVPCTRFITQAASLRPSRLLLRLKHRPPKVTELSAGNLSP